MTDRREATLDEPVVKPKAGDTNPGALHSEAYGVSAVGQYRDTSGNGGSDSKTLPPLFIEGLESKSGAKNTSDGQSEGKDKTDQEIDAATRSDTEMLGQYSINGQNRYLDVEGTKLSTVKMDKADEDKAEGVEGETPATAPEGVPPPGPVPFDLKEVVGEEREAEFSKAFELMDRFDKSVNEDVLKPGINKLSDMLDQAERDMPKAKLDALEAERKKYGIELKDYQESTSGQPEGSGPVMSNLLYRQPPERGPEMKEFDRTVQGITTEVGKEMAANMQAVGAKFDKSGDLSAADEKVKEYFQLKEELAPHPQPEPNVTDV